MGVGGIKKTSAITWVETGEMATLSISKGISAASRIPHHALLVVGQTKHLKAVSFDRIAAKLDGYASTDSWNGAVDRLPPKGSLPLFHNLATVIAIPESESRHNSPACPHFLTKQLKETTLPNEVTGVSIVVLCEYAHSLASVAAIARAFPLFTRKTKPAILREIIVELYFTDRDEVDVGEEDIEALSNLARNIRTTARLVDTPANEMTTDELVKEALAIGNLLESSLLLYKGEELLQRGFGGIYNVGKAALNPPAFLVLSHKPIGSNHTYALVGKGIVYDTGGMQIKGKTMMPGMKCDMGGAAALLCAFATLVQAGFRENLHVCLCIAENNISPLANKPDDIITLLSGKSCEINNTDAEGRLVLSDGVFYAKDVLNADFILDMATLTGAQSQMTGKYHAALLTNNEAYEEKAAVAGRFSGDLIHSMVFAPDLHFPDLKSSVADMKNTNLGKMTGPPSAIAGLFIGSNIDFGKDVDWLHVDMAAPCMDGERATGYGVALVTALLGEHTNSPLLQSGLASFK